MMRAASVFFIVIMAAASWWSCDKLKGGSDQSRQSSEGKRGPAALSESFVFPVEGSGEHLELKHVSLSQDGLVCHLKIAVENRTKTTFSYLALKISVFDKSGNPIDSSLVSVDSLFPGKRAIRDASFIEARCSDISQWLPYLEGAREEE